MRASDRELRTLGVDEIDPNPENPRLYFRPEEMDQLLSSILHIGVQVPITVYKEGGRYRLLDGERRWRCSKKLNLKTIPALVQPKPSELENLLLMYNIHAVREQWDYLTIATSLERIINLFRRERGHVPNEVELSEETGLTRGAVRRCFLLINLPQKFKKMLLQELELPKAQQQLSEDTFIEMEKALKTVNRRLLPLNGDADEVREVLIEKVRNETIQAITDFRLLSKIATAVDRFGLEKKAAVSAVRRVFRSDNHYSIRDAYAATVETVYDEQKARRQVDALITFIDDVVESDEEIDAELLRGLRRLYSKLHDLLAEYR